MAPSIGAASGLAGPIILWCLIWVLAAAPAPAGEPASPLGAPGVVDVASCMSCHREMAQAALGSGHDLACVRCHLESAGRDEPRIAHHRIIANPSGLGPAPDSCGACHASLVLAVGRMIHASGSGIINQTRYLWGAQASPSPASPGALNRPGFMTRASDRPRTPAMLVDDFLHRNCLSCHLGSASPHRSGGCAACHRPASSLGLEVQAPQDRESPRPHILQRDVADENCLACHNGNHAGGDYHGLFLRDSHPVYQQALTLGRLVPRMFGAARHILARDVHARAGMGCTDCHSGAQVMGLDGPPPSCADCHGGYAGGGPKPVPGRLISLGAAHEFISRDGRTRALPAFNRDNPAHGTNHSRLRCSACHAQWFYGDYGLSVLSDGRKAPGNPWTLDWRFRRWEYAALGLDGSGRISALRPRHQYLVSRVDRLGRVVLDSVVPVRGDGSGPGWAFEPYAPHTTGRAGRQCGECHGDPVAAGLGPSWAANTDFSLLAASPPARPGARLLNRAERSRLLDPGLEYARLFARTLLDRELRNRIRLGAVPDRDFGGRKP